jgi:stage IV sporulation protein B
MKEERMMIPPAMVLILKMIFLAAALILLQLMTGSARAAEPVPAFSAAGKAFSSLTRVLDLPQRLWEQGAKGKESGKQMVVPLGHTVGIKLFSEGVMVVGITDIATENGPKCPAEACGLREGDILTHLDGKQVNSIEEVKLLLEEGSGAPMTVRVRRDQRQTQVTVTPVLCADGGGYKLGAWIRDSMGGIGTVTFYEPKSGVFGALGHGIMDVDTMLLMPLRSGAVMYSTVTDVTRGKNGSPGQLHGTFCLTQELGSLYSNTDCGIFGTMEQNALTKRLKPVPAAARSEVKVGPATILSNIAGDEVTEYEVEIMRVYPENGQSSRNLLLKVTDGRLLAATGGIVQGMSGSPILQDGKLVGAVTHVLVSDPTEGYGILIENMLDEMFCLEEQDAS